MPSCCIKRDAPVRVKNAPVRVKNAPVRVKNAPLRVKNAPVRVGVLGRLDRGYYVAGDESIKPAKVKSLAEL